MKARVEEVVATLRPSDELRHAEERAVAIRKLLGKLKQGNSREVRRVMDDAIEVLETIEQLSRRGQASSAEDAAMCLSGVEACASTLREILVRILAS